MTLNAKGTGEEAKGQQVQGNLETVKQIQHELRRRKTGDVQVLSGHCEAPVDRGNPTSSGSQDAVTEAPLIRLLVDDHGILHIISCPAYRRSLIKHQVFMQDTARVLQSKSFCPVYVITATTAFVPMGCSSQSTLSYLFQLTVPWQASH